MQQAIFKKKKKAQYYDTIPESSEEDLVFFSHCDASWFPLVQTNTDGTTPFFSIRLFEYWGWMKSSSRKCLEQTLVCLLTVSFL